MVCNMVWAAIGNCPLNYYNADYVPWRDTCGDTYRGRLTGNPNCTPCPDGGTSDGGDIPIMGCQKSVTNQTDTRGTFNGIIGYTVDWSNNPCGTVFYLGYTTYSSTTYTSCNCGFAGTSCQPIGIGKYRPGSNLPPDNTDVFTCDGYGNTVGMTDSNHSCFVTDCYVLCPGGTDAIGTYDGGGKTYWRQAR